MSHASFHQRTSSATTAPPTRPQRIGSWSIKSAGSSPNPATCAAWHKLASTKQPNLPETSHTSECAFDLIGKISFAEDLSPQREPLSYGFETIAEQPSPAIRAPPQRPHWKSAYHTSGSRFHLLMTIVALWTMFALVIVILSISMSLQRGIAKQAATYGATQADIPRSLCTLAFLNGCTIVLGAAVTIPLLTMILNKRDRYQADRGT